jgi:hypothetical protein
MRDELYRTAYETMTGKDSIGLFRIHSRNATQKSEAQLELVGTPVIRRHPYVHSLTVEDCLLVGFLTTHQHKKAISARLEDGILHRDGYRN